MLSRPHHGPSIQSDLPRHYSESREPTTGGFPIFEGASEHKILDVLGHSVGSDAGLEDRIRENMLEAQQCQH